MTHFHDATSDEIYRENILDHAANPRHFGELPNASWSHRERNPSCGDDLAFHVRVVEGKIAEIGFSGTGCAVSKAAASMLSERIIGMTLADAAAFSFENMLALLGVPVTSSRLTCALLGLTTLQKGIAAHADDTHSVS